MIGYTKEPLKAKSERRAGPVCGIGRHAARPNSVIGVWVGETWLPSGCFLPTKAPSCILRRLGGDRHNTIPSPYQGKEMGA